MFFRLFNCQTSAPFAKPHLRAYCGCRRFFAHERALPASAAIRSASYASIRQALSQTRELCLSYHFIPSLDKCVRKMYNPIFDTKKRKKALHPLILLGRRAFSNIGSCTLRRRFFCIRTNFFHLFDRYDFLRGAEPECFMQCIRQFRACISRLVSFSLIL